MCKTIKWTQSVDDTIRTMRQGRFSWDAIAQACGIAHRQQIIDRAKILDIQAPERNDVQDDEAERGTLAAGSSATWDAINARLASVAGAAYPLPVVRT